MMLKPHIELIRNNEPQVLLTWHKRTEDGEVIPIAMEFSDAIDDELRQRIVNVCERPLTVVENGRNKKVFSGSSAHFSGLPKVLGRLGFRTRQF